MTERKIYVRLRTEEQLHTVTSWGRAACILPEMKLLPKLPDLSGPYYLSLPDVAREKSREKIRTALEEVREGSVISGVVVKNPDELGLLEETHYTGGVIGDSILYAYNREAARFYLDLFPQIRFLCSDELTYREIRQMTEGTDLEERMIYKIYGYQQLMVTAQCISRNYTGCKRKQIPFRDEKGELFYAVSECEECYSRIYNGRPTYLLDKLEEIEFSQVLLDFTMEQEKEVRTILRQMDAAEAGTAATAASGGPMTRGHHYVGID